ncbi:TrmH family RNA methyltransferase [Dermatobacter hominis]|uniref:TrmH family RNA methyltransferase n=1 Tax=Dermatobacter hominis TaxID=2884263 RepID=UPI001D11963B|nr:RNA methyltransferase [Dermatobacter hominis]UDY36221.1 RNA methyltransferase [Dermatobacter hominis]
MPSDRTPTGPDRPPAGQGPSKVALQELRRLSRRRSARSDAGAYLIDGPVLLGEAVEAGVALRTVFVEPAARSHPSVLAAVAAGVEVRDVDEGALARVLDVVTPQSVVAIASQAPAVLDDVLRIAVETGRPVLVLVELQDPGNAGTLVRVAEAAGCAGVVLTPRSVDLHNPKTVRSTAGALFRVPVVEGVEAVDVIGAAAAAGLASWATVRDGGTALDAAELGGACLVLVGSEAHGLPDDVAAAASGRVSIPMEGEIESLNAAVAGALVVFEAARQRRSGPGAAGPEPVRGAPGPLGHDVSAAATAGPAPTREERSK